MTNHQDTDQYGNDYVHDEFDQRAFAAGRALQQSAPTEGLARVRSSYRRRRTANAVAVGAVALLFAGGVFAYTRSRPTPATADLTTDTVNGVPTPSTSPPAPTNPATTAASAPATAAPVATQPTAPPSSAPAPTTVAAAPATEAGTSLGQLVFWNHAYLGYWGESGFVGANTQKSGPDGLLGSKVTLRNTTGATHEAEVVDCDGDLILSPTPPFSDDDSTAYWYTDGAPFTITIADDDSTLAAMNDALTARALDPALADSFGAPLAADGSADRVVWYTDDQDFINWVATFDAETGEFRTIDGDPTKPSEIDAHYPSTALVDLDGDGNLESRWGFGDLPFELIEWATNDTPITASVPCG